MANPVIREGNAKLNRRGTTVSPTDLARMKRSENTRVGKYGLMKLQNGGKVNWFNHFGGHGGA